MLVLTLHEGEYAEISVPGCREKVKVMLVQSSPTRSRVGFEAPEKFSILRSSLVEKDRDNQKPKHNSAWHPKLFSTNRYASRAE